MGPDRTHCGESHAEFVSSIIDDEPHDEPTQKCCEPGELPCVQSGPPLVDADSIQFGAPISADDVLQLGAASVGGARKHVDLIGDPWTHRSKGMKCKTCMWFVVKATSWSAGHNVGRCRRHAPTMSGYPVVFVNDWCGDHKLNENST